MHQGTLPIHVTSSDTAQLKSLIRQMSGILKWKHFSVNIADQDANEYFFFVFFECRNFTFPSRFSCGNWACQDPFFHHAKFLLYIKSESHQPDSFCHRLSNQLIIRYFKSPIEISRGFLFSIISYLKYNSIYRRVTIILALTFFN